MEVSYTYAELAKKFGCTELTVRNWLKNRWVKITPGKRGRNGGDAIITMSTETCKALARDVIEYAKHGKKPFSNFEMAEWNNMDKVVQDLPTVKLLDIDNDHNQFKRFEDNFSITAMKTVYFLSEDNRIYKVVLKEDSSYHFRSMSDYKLSEFDREFNRQTLMDSTGKFWQPVMILNSKGEWITEPKRKKK